MPLTEEQRVRYLMVHEGSRCPFCDDHRLDTLDVPHVSSDMEVTLDVRCFSCCKTWRDIFRLHDVEEIEEELDDDN